MSEEKTSSNDLQRLLAPCCIALVVVLESVSLFDFVGGADLVVAVLVVLVAVAAPILSVRVLGSTVRPHVPETIWRLLVALGTGAWAGVTVFFTLFALGPELAQVPVLGTTGVFPPTPALLTIGALSGLTSLLTAVVLFREVRGAKLLGTLVVFASFFSVWALASDSARQLGPVFGAMVLAWYVLVGFRSATKHAPPRAHYLWLVSIPALLIAYPNLSNDARLALTERLTFATSWLPRTDIEQPRYDACATLETTERTVPVPKKRGTVLIVVDTLRFDRVNTDLMPAASQFVSDADLVFERAYTPSPHTSASFKSMLHHKKPDAVIPRLAEADVTIQGVIAHPAVRSFLPGADAVDDIAEGRDFRFALTSEEVTDRALDRLRTLDDEDRFLLLVHYYDPHEYYVPNPDFDFGWSATDRYDAEVAYTDRALGRLLEALGEHEDIAVILTSDHGEELGDHGYVSHGYALYDESSRVVLAMQADGVSKTRHEPPVSNAVVAELLLGTLTDHTPSVSLEPVVLEQGSKTGLVAGQWKAIWDDETQIGELYDLDQDPGETENLYGSQPFPGVLCAEQILAP